MEEEKAIRYTNACSVWSHFNKACTVPLTFKEFHLILDVMRIVGSDRNQKRTVDLFKTLSKEEVIKRVNTVIKLDSISQSIKDRRKYDFQGKKL